MPPDRKDIITERGEVANKLLTPNYSEDHIYDVIVVGSGMGGGVVASALADEGKDVLVLEAGSLLFPTHIGNLPRRLLIGRFQKHIWSLWDRFAVNNYTTPGGSVYDGGQGFNLGGRSIFWGSSIPPLAKWELEAWPQAIQDYLLDKSDSGGYAIARGVFNSDVPTLDKFHTKSTTILKGLFDGEWEVLPAPVAVEYSGATEWSIPAGIFSTADLLLEDTMAESIKENRPSRAPLTVNTNSLARYVTFNQKTATGVHCLDLYRKQETTYKAKAVVLSAGTLESAKIAMNSGIPNVGTGITDHPIWYQHFVVPPEALKDLDLISDRPSTRPPRAEPQSTKILIRHENATATSHGFDIILELGANFNQGRFIDRDHIYEEMDIRNGYLLCEIVFQFYAPLMEANSVTLAQGNDNYAAVSVNMQRAQTDPGLLQEAREIAKAVFIKFKAQPVFTEEALFIDNVANLKEAAVGGVAHEVGTLRMPVNGKKGVLDENLKFEGYENLYACDNSVFPCSPAGNPSLTLVALARRLAKRLAAVVK